jgi:hypothetical protein
MAELAEESEVKTEWKGGVPLYGARGGKDYVSEEWSQAIEPNGRSKVACAPGGRGPG